MSWFWSILGYADSTETVKETELYDGTIIDVPKDLPIEKSILEDTVAIQEPDVVQKDNILPAIKIQKPESYSTFIHFYQCHPISFLIKEYWNNKNGVSVDFQKNYEKLKIFIRDRKRLPCRSTSNKNEKKLALWIQKMKRSKLNREQEKMIREIPSLTDNEIFVENCNLVNSFAVNNNRLPYPASMNKFERYLGNWLHRNIKLYSEDKLTIEKIDMLKRISLLDWSIYE